ncbi:SycD/LcrH family type III secretion system chaperone, partial [Escherichia coli]|nr:SycD/LcrH family type III secretion system chaperone [Escherichia coli]
MNSKEFLDKISSTFQTSVKLLKFNPLEQLSWDELEILYERGYNAWNEGKYEEATDIFAFLTLHKPLEREFMFAFACAIKEQGEYRHALTLFTYTLAMRSDDPFSIFHIAECLLNMQEYEAARDALDSVISLCYEKNIQDTRYSHLRERAEMLLIR